jgi:hypothetical protein
MHCVDRFDVPFKLYLRSEGYAGALSWHLQINIADNKAIRSSIWQDTSIQFLLKPYLSHQLITYEETKLNEN